MSGNEGAEVVDLTPWDITVKGAEQRERAHQLLEREDADQAIRDLTELEAYYAIKAMGSDQAAPFLLVLEQQQIRTLLDLEIWDGDRVAAEDMLVWFEAFRECGVHRVQAAAKALDIQAMAALFSRRCMVAVVPPDPDDDPPPDWVENPPLAIQPIVQTPDLRFYVAARNIDVQDELDGGGYPLDEEERKSVMQLIDDIYRDEDIRFAAAVMHIAAADTTSSLEEEAFGFRNARLEDFGFPPMQRAIEVFAPVDPDALLVADNPHSEVSGMRIPAIYAGQLDDGLFKSALREIDDPQLIRSIESELVTLANAVLVVDRVNAGQLEMVEESLLRMRGYLELALAHKTDPGTRLDTAVARLTDHGMRPLFSAGYSIALKLASRAKKVPLGMLSEDDRALLEPLRQKHPHVADANRARSLLDVLEPLSGLGLEPIEGDVVPPPEEQTIDVLLATLAARVILAAPDGALSREALTTLAQRASGGFSEKDIAVAQAAVSSELAGRVAERLAAIANELGALDSVDPRFVTVVVAAL